jgi:uncharacterized protein YjiK
MKRRRVLVTIFMGLLLLSAGCTRGGDETPYDRENKVLISREERLNKSLAEADSSEGKKDEPVALWVLPPELGEISGLALTSDDRLFAHDDETARISEIDYRRGSITKHFFAGANSLRGDFEGLTCVGDRFYLLDSKGLLYEFSEGQDEQRVDVTKHDTHLGKECEFEGLAYDATANAIMMACKNTGEKKNKGMLVLYRYPLDAGDKAGISELAVPMSEVIGKNNWEQVRPTDLAIDPSNGNYVMVDAQEKALIVLTPTGDVVLSRPLDGKHPQAEGIAITHDHILIISDESKKGGATITLYRWP